MPETNTIEWFLSHIAWEILRAATEKGIRRLQLGGTVKDWSGRLNRQFAGEFEILKESCGEPTIISHGPYSLARNLQAEANRQLKEINARGRPNDPHAILSREPNWYAEPVNLYVQTLDFAGVSALRKVGQRPEILSAGAVIICREKQEILLHQRESDVATYPGCLHTLGGSYIPLDTGTTNADRGGALSIVQREVHEESQISLSTDAPPHLMISKELTTGFIQLVFLGFTVPSRTMDRISGNWEGSLERVPFRHLPEVLSRQTWVPSGKAHVLAWLALGAPNAGMRPRFGGQSPKQLFETFVA